MNPKRGEEPTAFAERVAQDFNEQKLAHLAVAGWAWSVSGWIAGVITLAGLWIALVVATLVGGEDRGLSSIRRARWACIVIAFLIVVGSSIEISGTSTSNPHLVKGARE